MVGANEKKKDSPMTNDHSSEINIKASENYAASQARVANSMAGAASVELEADYAISGNLDFGRRAMWFVMGLIGNIFGMLGAWAFTGAYDATARRQAALAAWAGVAAQTLLVLLAFQAGIFVDASTVAQPAATSVAFG